LGVWSCQAVEGSAPSPPNPGSSATATETQKATHRGDPGDRAKQSKPPKRSKRVGPSESAAKSPPAPQIHALDLRVYIRERPSETSPEIGALRIGQGVSLKSTRALKGAGCENPGEETPSKAGWFPVEPAGYVCLDRTTTLDPKHPL